MDNDALPGHLPAPGESWFNALLLPLSSNEHLLAKFAKK